MMCACCQEALETLDEAATTLDFAAQLLEIYNLPKAATFRHGVERVKAAIQIEKEKLQAIGGER